MSDFATKLLPMVKKTLRQADNEFDDEIGSYIDTVATDLQDAGIHYSFFSSTKPGWVLDGQILQACRWYALSVFGLYNPDMEKYALAYASLKATLATQKRYTAKGQYPTGYEDGFDAGYADAVSKLTDLVATENGDYTPSEDSIGFKGVVVNVTKLPEVKRKTVSFVDYDGTILHTYSADEIKAMTDMPPLPTREGLICQGWNWTLDEIKQYIADFEVDNRHLYPFDVGAIYITDDGKYRFVLNIDCEDVVEFDVSFVFNTGSYYGALDVDWGDGSEVDSFWLRGYGYPKHTYTKSGRYTVSLTSIGYVTSLFSPNNNACSLEEVYLGGTSNIKASLFAKQRNLKIVTIPNSVTEIGEKAFSFCTGLKHINLPDGIATLGASAFAGSGVKRLTLPSKIQTMGSSIVSPGSSDDYTGLTEHITFRSPILGSGVARNLATLEEVNLAKTTKTIPTYAFYFAHSMRRFYVPSDIESIGDEALYVQLRLIDCTACRNIPTITNYSLSNQKNPVIRVPLHKLEKWKSATNWSDRAGLMVGIEVPWANE